MMVIGTKRLKKYVSYNKINNKIITMFTVIT